MAIRVVQVLDEADKRAVHRFLDETRAAEADAGQRGSAPGQDALDDWACHFTALDDAGNIAGCFRCNLLRDGRIGGELEERLGLRELQRAFPAAQLSYSSRLVVAADLRGHTVASRLVAASLQRLLCEGVRVDCSCCGLSLIHLHYQLGCRPYLSAFREPGAGVQQPMAFLPRDLGHLREVESPLAALVPADLDDDGETALRMRRIFPEFRDPGFDRISSRALWARLARADAREGGQPPGLLDGLDADDLARVAPHVVRQIFAAGQHVYRAGEREPGMGLVLSGALGVAVPGASQRVVAVLGPGQPFGELQALGAAARSADLVALERSELLLLPPDLLDRVGRADPELGFRLARRLLIILGQRLSAANKENFDAERAHAEPARPERPALYAQWPDLSEAAPPAAFAPAGSAELGRVLAAQAALVASVELPALTGAGLRDGHAVLVCGAGAALAACALARRFPTCRVVLAEPDAAQRAEAECLVARQGLGERCRILAGGPDGLPLPDGTVDFAWARRPAERFAEPARLISELRRVTRIGGVVCALEPDDGTLLLHPPGASLAALRGPALPPGASQAGRHLRDQLAEAGLRGVHVNPLPAIAEALGPDAFFEMAFGASSARVERGGDPEAVAALAALRVQLRAPACFAAFTCFLAHGLVPTPPTTPDGSTP